MCFQELSLANSLSVSENIFAVAHLYGMVNWKSLNAQAEKLLKQFELVHKRLYQLETFQSVLANLAK